MRTAALLLLVLAPACTTVDPRAMPELPLTYPRTEQDATGERIHGELIADPYRWLEDPESPRTQAWVRTQNDVTLPFLKSLPEREGIEARMTELWNYARMGVPSREQGFYLYQKNDGLQNQAVLYAADRLSGTERVLLDPNTLSKDGTVALGGLSVSEDGSRLAYMLSEAGSDWNRIEVLDTTSGKPLADRVEWVKFSGLSWAKDGSGFYYSTYPVRDKTGKQALKNHQLYFHRLGTPQSDDRLVYERKDQPEWGFGGRVSEDGKLLIITVTQGTDQRTRVHVQDLEQPDSPVVPLLDAFDAEYECLGKLGRKLYFKTNKDAPRGRIVSLDLDAPGRLQEIVPQSSDTLESASFAGGHVLALYMRNAISVLRLYDASGKLLREPSLPELGSIGVLSAELDEPEAFFSFASFTRPTEIWRLDTQNGATEQVFAPKVGFDPSQYETRQVFYTSKDGTRIPLFVCARKGLNMGPATPCMLYGYGGFNIPMKPAFSVANLVWMERGGIYAVACLRGGGEYGRDWHQAGTKLRKQNVFDDFHAAAEFLARNNYTSARRIAIRGGSNGGLLVGACLLQRPELYGCALPAVGVLDMLRYQRFTIGWAWASDYGDVADPEQFRYLLGYSPVHNVKANVAYPPTLITTGDHDDRVVPAHSYKFAAALQAVQKAPAPVLIRIETRGGHGAGKPTAMQIEELADQWAFALAAIEGRFAK